MASSNLRPPNLYAIVESDQDELEVIETKDPSASAYEYAPLPSKGDHLRLIELAPGKVDSPIHIKIETYELESSINTPDYYALSRMLNDPGHDNLVISG